MEFLESIAQYIEQHSLLCRDELNIVALSGGADSVALLLVLQQLGYRVEAVHCNFHLRGDESNRDEAFVRKLCEERGVKLHLAHFDTHSYADTHHVSIEMAARNLRYNYFGQLRHDISADAVCVAHHRDDAVETLLINLLRGTGIHGLTGIRPRNGHIVRPLLCVSRADILAYLNRMGQPFVTDSTNLVADVVRNKVRLQVIPLLEQIAPAASERIAVTANNMAEAERVYDSAMAAACQRLTGVSSFSAIDPSGKDQRDITLSIPTLLQEPSPESLLFELLRPLGFNAATIQAIHQKLPPITHHPSPLFSSATHDVLIHGDSLIISPHREPMAPLTLPEAGCYAIDNGKKIRLTVTQGATVSRDPMRATIDADKATFPLTLRTIQDGDRFKPFGMNGSRLVSDYLTDKKVPLTEKRRTLVLTTADGHIVWLAAHRTDQRFAVTPDTQQTLTIELF